MEKPLDTICGSLMEGSAAGGALTQHRQTDSCTLRLPLPAMPQAGLLPALPPTHAPAHPP